MSADDGAVPQRDAVARRGPRNGGRAVLGQKGHGQHRVGARVAPREIDGVFVERHIGGDQIGINLGSEQLSLLGYWMKGLVVVGVVA